MNFKNGHLFASRLQCNRASETHKGCVSIERIDVMTNADVLTLAADRPSSAQTANLNFVRLIWFEGILEIVWSTQSPFITHTIWLIVAGLPPPELNVDNRLINESAMTQLQSIGCIAAACGFKHHSVMITHWFWQIFWLNYSCSKYRSLERRAVRGNLELELPKWNFEVNTKQISGGSREMQG